MGLWSKRLIVVAGKGGVGKTTVAISLALAAASTGRRAAVVELDGAAGVPEAWGLPERTFEPQPLVPGVETLSLSAAECLDDFGRFHLRSRTLTELAFHNPFMAAFMDAVPGMQDLLQLGKLRNLVEVDGRYRPVVVDAPATGHGLTLLAAARSMTEMTRIGPFHDASKAVEDLLSDPERTAHVLVTLPEELPVNESVDFLERLGDDRRLVAAVVVDQVRADPLPPPPPWPVVQAALSTGAALAPVLAVARRAKARLRVQATALDHLREDLPRVLGRTVPVVELPRVSGTPDRNDRRAFGEVLAAALAVDGASP